MMEGADVDSPLRLLSVCSGIGGLDLGASQAVRVQPVAYAERDAYAASVLLARMEEEALGPAPVWIGDLHNLDARPFRGWIDVVAAGIPCVSWSVAGKRAGIEDERHLGAELVRIVRDVEPMYVLVENVPGFAVRDGLGFLLGELAELGFDAEWATLRAADVGAPHRRRRIFILAYRRSKRLQGDNEGGTATETTRRSRGTEVQATSGNPAVGPVPRLRELPMQHPRDTRARLSMSERRGVGEKPLPPWPPGPDGDWSGVPERLAPATQPDLCGVAHGLPSRVDRLRALGNAVVPPQAELAFRELFKRLNS